MQYYKKESYEQSDPRSTFVHMHLASSSQTVQDDRLEECRESPPEHKKSFQTESNNTTDLSGSESEYYIYQNKWRFVTVLIGILLSFFLETIDQTIVAATLSTIGSEFNAFTQTGWIPSAYMLTLTAFQPIYGNLSDIFGRRSVIVLSIAIFVLGSALCGAAQNMTWLISSRAVAGIGGAGIVAMATVTISDLVPMKERANYFSLLSIVMALSYAIGPAIGGLFADKVSWRWAFYINVPVAAVAVVIIIWLLRIPRKMARTWNVCAQKIDFGGITLFLCFMVPLLLAFNWAGKEYKWSSAVVISLLCVSAALGIAFVCFEKWVAPEPMIPMDAFKQRNIVLLLLTHFCAGVMMFSFVYYTPMLIIVSHNATATISGICLLPILISLSLVSLVVSWSIPKFGLHRTYIIFAMAGLSLGSGIFTLLKRDSPIGMVLGFLFIPGICLGFMFPIVTVGVQVSAKPQHITAVTTLVPFAFAIAGALGLSILGSVLTNTFKAGISDFITDYPEYTQLASNVLDKPSLIWTSSISEDARNKIIDAFVKSLHLIFYANAGISGLGFILSLGLKKFKLRSLSTLRPNQVTLALLKPDLCASAEAVEKTLKTIESEIDPMQIVAKRSVLWSINDAQEFYREHEGKFFYKRLVGYMTNGEFIAMVLKGPDVISRWRKLIGPTRPPRARISDPNSLRAQFGITDTRNSFHGSDSMETSLREIPLLFPDIDIKTILEQTNKNNSP
ncbi:hypothetical protein H4219_003021 [Mycoemilia scoparia]|uniref:Nucleoside diphosphate kinase n=1 Tax=Mycoemilia scoparia TaxID=417184 RepID=A0A9W7ZZV2_9FUNG|nr:hypothetical protein H4219_003021 [Mycoemilia scoparia]